MQTAVLECLAIMHSLPGAAKPSGVMLESMLRALTGWVDVGPQQHALLPAWQDNMTACLEVLCVFLCKGSSRKGLHRLIEAVATLAASPAVPLEFRARLCRFLARCAYDFHASIAG